MITAPSCPGEGAGKDPAPGSTAFEDELGELGPAAGHAQGVAELASYSQSYGGQGPHYGGGHYGHYGGGGWQPDYCYYGQGGQAYYPAHYQAAGGPGAGLPYHQEWAGQPGHMVLPPGPSPTGSNNSPSPHGFSDTNDDSGAVSHHVISRTELKRPSPDSFLPHPSLGHQVLHHQSVPKKPKVSKRRKKRDPNEPQKPVSAYALFFRDTQANIKLRNPSANFGEVSKIVAATWDGLDPDNKAAYKKRTEMAKKEYLRALASYRANMVSKGSGHELYGGFPGYGSMLLGAGQAMEQAMPATGLGLPSPAGIHMAGPGQYQGAGPYHPGYMQQLQQHQQQPGGAPSPGGPSRDPGHSQHSPKLEMKEESQSSSYDSYVQRSQQQQQQQFPSGPHSHGYQPSHPSYPGQAPAEPGPGQYGGVVNRAGGKCGRPGCPHFQPGHAEFCSSECVVGECKEVFSSWSSCMVKPGPAGPTPDVMVK